MPEIEIDNFNIAVPDKNYSNCCQVEIIEDNIQYKDFFDFFLLQNLPCIVKNVSKNWESVGLWLKDGNINYEYLEAKYGNLEAPVRDCNKEVNCCSHSTDTMKVSNFIEYLKNDRKGQILYLKDWHLRRVVPSDKFYEVPLIFASDWLNEFSEDQHDDDFMFVYMGPENSWTPLHADVFSSYSWSVNVTGRKKWILFPPGEELKLKDKFRNLPDMFESEKHGDVKYFEVIQEKGDALFVPSGWHHQVTNLLDTISINHNWINGCNIEYVWEALQAELIAAEHEIEEYKHTEEFAMQCQKMVKNSFGMDFEMFSTFVCHIGKKRLNYLQTNNFKGFNNYTIGKNHVIFDLMTIVKIMDKIVNHNLFLNKDIIPIEKQNELLDLKETVLQYMESIN